MNDNILKFKKDNINLSKTVSLESFLDMKKITEHDFSKKLYLNGFSITKKEDVYFIKKSPTFNIKTLMSIINKILGVSELNYILTKHMRSIEQIRLKKEKITSSIEKLIGYVYLDVLLLIEIASYKHNHDQPYRDEIKMIEQISGVKRIYSVKKEKENGKKYKRSHVANRSKQSLYFNHNEHSKSLPLCIKKVCAEIGFDEFEIPPNYNVKSTLSMLTMFKQVVDSIKLRNRRFALRFKKIAHYRKTGLYIKNAKTLVVDPRTISSLFHELGHFIYENKCTIELNDHKVEADDLDKIVDQNMKRYETKIKNHKIEEINVSSEVFAYYFEDVVAENLNIKNNGLL